MRTRIGNPFNEPHGNPMLVLDWIAPAGTKAEDVLARAEAALVVTLHADAASPSGPVQGFVQTSLRPNGNLYAAVCIYRTACAGCQLQHAATFQAPTAPSADQTTTMLTNAGDTGLL